MLRVPALTDRLENMQLEPHAPMEERDEIRRHAARTTLLKIAAAAAGITLALCVATAGVFWYVARPKPQKPWNTQALRVTEVKAEPISRLDEKFRETSSGVFFTVDIENTTGSDLALPRTLTAMQEKKPSHAVHESFLKLDKDYFLPANHVAVISLSADDLCAANFDPQKCFDNYFKEEQTIILFDSENRYELRIPIPALTIPPYTNVKTPK
jgi:hypothetical protein